MTYNTGQYSPPIKENEEWNLKIEGFGDKGDPIGKVEKFVIFIKDENNETLPKDTVELGKTYKVIIHRITKTVAFAKLQSTTPIKK